MVTPFLLHLEFCLDRAPLSFRKKKGEFSCSLSYDSSSPILCGNQQIDVACLTFYLKKKKKRRKSFKGKICRLVNVKEVSSFLLSGVSPTLFNLLMLSTYFALDNFQSTASPSRSLKGRSSGY